MIWIQVTLPVYFALFLLLGSVFTANDGKLREQRNRREVTSLLSDLASQFFNRGGNQGVTELNNSEDKMGVLKRYLGSALVGAMFGNGDDLISRIMGSFGGGGSKNNNVNTGSSSGTGSGGYRPPSSSIGDNSPPITNSKTGVSIVNSRPGDRSPSTNSNTGFDSSRRGSTGNGNFDEDIPSSSRRGSGSSGGRNGVSTDLVPQSGASSKTGVSIINSRPDDRPRVPSTNSGRANPNNNNNGAAESSDYEAEGPFVPSRTGNDRSSSASARGSGADTPVGGYGRYSGNRRGSDSGEVSSGRRGGAGSRAAPSTADADSY